MIRDFFTGYNLLKGKYMEEKNNKIINIASIKNTKNKLLTESDIMALFLGLVKLIKKNASLEVEDEIKKDCLEANYNFRQTLIDLNKTEALLKKEQEKNLKLSNKIIQEEKKFCLLFNKYMQGQKL